MMMLAQVLLALPMIAAPEVAGPQEAAPELPTREFGGGTVEVKCFAVDAKAERVVIATTDGKLYLWDYRKEELTWSTQWSPSSVGVDTALGLDFGDETVVFSFIVPSVTELDAETGEKTGAVGGTNIRARATAMVGDPRDRWVWVGADDGVMMRLTPKEVQGYSKRSMKNGGVTCIARDAKGNLLAVGGEDKSIRFVNAKSANVDDKKVFDDLEARPTALAFDRKGSKLVSGTADGELRIWKVSSGKTEEVLSKHAAAIRAISIGPKGRWMASGDESGVVLLWDMKKLELLATLAGSGPIKSLAFLDKGDTLAWADGAQHLTLVDLSEL